MSRPVNISDSLVFTPAAWVSGSYYSITGQTNPIGKGSDNSSNYAQVNLTRNANAVTEAIWSFDCSSIPEGVTITSVTCSCKCSINNTQSNRITTRQAQLYSGTTAKGSAYTVANSTTAFNITCGTWTRAELQNARIRLYAVRGTNNTTSSYYFRFYGATLTVNYSISGTEYEVSISNTSESVTTQPSTTQYVFQGGSQEITITTSNINSISVTDNNVDVTSQLVQASPNYYTYTISNISADHTIVIENVPLYVTVTNENVYVTNVSPSGTTDIEDGDNYLLTFRSTTATLGSNLFVIDNDVDKTSDIIYYETLDGDFTENNILANSYENGNNTANFTVSNINYAYRSSSSTSNNAILRMGSVTNTTAGIYFIFDTSFLNNIPASVNSFNVTCKIRDAVANGNAITSVTKQLYSGTTPKGSIDTTAEISSGVRTIDGGTWTRSELNNIRLYYTATTGSTTSSYNNIFFSGTDLTVSYSCHEPAHYEYTITNVVEDHNIVITDRPSESLYLKVNGQFVRCTKIYKKINNVWTEVNLNTLTDPGIYIKK